MEADIPEDRQRHAEAMYDVYYLNNKKKRKKKKKEMSYLFGCVCVPVGCQGFATITIIELSTL